jgi:quinol monooxygenase YgiN
MRKFLKHSDLNALLSTKFIHVGKFSVKPNLRNQFLMVIKEFEQSANNTGLNLSYLLDSENEPNTFWYITIWSSKEFWEKSSKLEHHLRLSEQCHDFLSRPVHNNFGNVLL